MPQLVTSMQSDRSIDRRPASGWQPPRASRTARSFPALLLLLLLLAAASCAHAQALPAAPRYAVTVIGGAGSAAYDVNIHGDVAGEFAVGDTGHAFLYAGGALNDLGTGGGTYASARHLNDGGEVVGTLRNGDAFSGFMYSGGQLQTMAGTTSANGINNSGTVTGVFGVVGSDGFAYSHAYSYAAGVYTDVGTLAPDTGSYGYAINNAGVIAGSAELASGLERPSSVIRYQNGVLSDLGGFVGPFAYGYSINDAGDIVGQGTLGPTDGELYPHRALLYAGGTLRQLGSLIPDGESAAYDINNLGQIVGTAAAADGARGFLVVDGALVDLNTLIDPASGWIVRDAQAINDVQQIAGTACKGDLCYAVRLDLAPPVPEPAGWAMALAGIGIVGMRQRRYRRRGLGHAGGRARVRGGDARVSRVST